MENKILASIGVLVLVVLLVIGNVALAFGYVGEDEVHVETQWGEATGEVYEDNRYMLGGTIPNGISYSAVALDTQPRTLQLQIEESLTRDGQEFSPVVSVTYQLNGDEAASFYSDSERSAPFKSLNMWEDRVGERAIEAAVHESTASISALEMVENYDTEEGADMATLREELATEVEDQLVAENGELSPEINIIEVRIESANPSDQLSQAFEAVAVESAEAERQLIDAEADADAARARADGQRDAFDTLVEAYGSEDAALQSEWIDAIKEDDGTIIIDAEAAPILDLNEGSNNESTANDSYFEDDE